jgi:hypothetical protein
MSMAIRQNHSLVYNSRLDLFKDSVTSNNSNNKMKAGNAIKQPTTQTNTIKSPK